MKLFRGTAKYLQKTLTFRRNTIVGVFFVYLLWEIFKQLITEVTHDQKVNQYFPKYMSTPERERINMHPSIPSVSCVLSVGLSCRWKRSIIRNR